MLKGLRDLGQLLILQANVEVQHLKIALEAYDLASQTVDLLRKTYRAEAAQIVLQENATPLFEAAIEVCRQLWELTKDTSYLERAFQFSEKNKSVVLQASIQAEAAIRFAALPAAVQAEEEALKNRLTSRTERYYQERDRGAASLEDSLDYYHVQLIEAQSEYNNFLARLESNYPDYYTLKFADKTATLREVQQNLKAGDQLLEYFWGEERLYRFLVTPSGIELSTLDSIKSFREALTEFVVELQDEAGVRNHSGTNTYAQHFVEQAHFLYEKLIGELQRSEHGDLIVIPDAELHALPFEVLLTRKVANFTGEDYGTLPYLIRQRPLRYAYSTRFITAAKDSDKATGMLAYAPAYPGVIDSVFAARDGFTPLAYTEQEVTAVQAMTGGEVLIGQQATKANFLANAADYGTLHLAMHAYTNDEAPQLSALVFAGGNKDSLNANKLHAYELYELSLRANLVVLSACNTGAGKIARGEGNHSLARAFRQAGAANILMSYWQADDETTSQLMQRFYLHLSDGQPKAQALRQAKLDLLEASNRKVHPYYWASFVLLGDADGVSFIQPWRWWYGVLGLGAFTLLFLVWARIKS
ncbi:MAG: CHAT domain-containing protein [Bacteroidota bacterium]